MKELGSLSIESRDVNYTLSLILGHPVFEATDSIYFNENRFSINFSDVNV